MSSGITDSEPSADTATVCPISASVQNTEGDRATDLFKEKTTASAADRVPQDVFRLLSHDLGSLNMMFCVRVNQTALMRLRQLLESAGTGCAFQELRKALCCCSVPSMDD